MADFCTSSETNTSAFAAELEHSELEADTLLTTASAVGSIVSDIVLTLLFSAFLLFSRSRGRVFGDIGGRSTFFQDIEDEIGQYVAQKTMISIMTAVPVGIILAVCGVPLAAMFGMLTFLFNFIPNIGSVLAVFLPLPLMLMTRMHTDETTKFWIAIAVPMFIQATVGNVLEPIILGNALNLGTIQVLAALVFWGVIWNLPGAILSTPLLSVMKIVLEHSGNEMSQAALRFVTNDPLKKVKEEKALKDLLTTLAREQLRNMEEQLIRDAEEAEGAEKEQTEKRRSLVVRVRKRFDAARNSKPISSKKGPTSNLIYVEWTAEDGERPLRISHK